MAQAYSSLKELIYYSETQHLVTSLLTQHYNTPQYDIIGSVNWQYNDRKADKANSYVSTLVKLLHAAHKTLDATISDDPNLVALLYNKCVCCMLEILLDQYCYVPLCDVQGRGAMVADVEQLITSLDSSSSRPTEENKSRRLSEDSRKRKSKVVSFLKVFYFDRQSDVEDWIRKHQRKYQNFQIQRLKESV